MMAPYGARTRRTNGPAALTLVFVLLCSISFVLLGSHAANAKPVRILVLGDSLAAGYGLAAPDAFQAQMTAALEASGLDVVLVDGAVSGDTTAGGRARLDWAIGDGVDAALVELGGNDGLRGLDPKATQANLAAILDALAAKKIPVLLSGMEAPPNLGADYAAAFRATFAGFASRPGLLYDPFFLEGVAGDPALNQPDHIHPNPAGVKKLVARLLPAMQRLVKAAQSGPAS